MNIQHPAICLVGRYSGHLCCVRRGSTFTVRLLFGRVAFAEIVLALVRLFMFPAAFCVAPVERPGLPTRF